MERERNKITSVCVYCASSTQVASAYREAATELGHLLGERNLRVINGAGNSGLMCAVSDAALAAGGTVTGVIPRFMVEQDWCWLLAKEEDKQEKLKSVMYHLSENLRKVAILISPFMEDTATSIFKQLGLTADELQAWDSLYEYDKIPNNTKVIEKGEPLFVRLDMEEEVNYIKEQMKGK